MCFTQSKLGQKPSPASADTPAQRATPLARGDFWLGATSGGNRAPNKKRRRKSGGVVKAMSGQRCGARYFFLSSFLNCLCAFFWSSRIEPTSFAASSLLPAFNAASVLSTSARKSFIVFW